ncbi:hypothetical protein [Rubrivivax gelatinosus]|uniref:hypothetical protein n=1 Tax=Rubrivivax gelatinosus TaxID=28068 RepID=UPI0009DA9F37|nr:hypothetical protein [Rubrivivax gelatinosus]
MNVALWLLLYVSNTAFVFWVVWGGGAVWFEGWRSLAIVDWLFAYRWNSEQIALYTLICWVGHTVWFMVGLFVPEARAFYW